MSEVNFDEKTKDSELPFLGTLEQMIDKYDQVNDNFKHSLEDFVAKVVGDKTPSNERMN